VLEEKQFTRVGGIETLTCDVRLIAATHRDLEAMIREREFREDLFYRLNVFPIETPPLRARGNDVVLLVHHHLRSRGREPGAISPDALRLLLGYGFPGNVRELQNLLERAMILAGGGTISLEHFPSLEGREAAGSPADRSGFIAMPEEGLSLEAVERDLIVKALEKAGGNKSQTARLLGITRRTLYSRMEKHGLLTPGGPTADAEDDGRSPEGAGAR
jgi:two-component system NtrC family response regulator